MPPNERELQLALIRAEGSGEPPARAIRRDPYAPRTLAELALALDATRHTPAPTPAEVRRAAGWLRLALWRMQAPTRPQ
jgi:hypothetical protein